jgi:outer membrane protein assembly factor BamB
MKSYARKLLPILFIVTILLVVVCGYGYIRLNGDTPPQWRNQKQSDLVIPQGGCISLQAEGMDTVSLHKAVLSTNETGVWRNETQYTALWRQDAVYGFDNFGTATYKDGVLYAPSKGDNNVYAVNASNGDIIWNKTVRQCDASPCIDGDVIYVGECSGPLGEPTPFPRAMALNKATGEEVWRFVEPDDYTWVGSPLVHGDYVYYTTLGSGVYALNKTNGTPIWHQDIGAIVCSVAYDNGAVFVSVNDPPSQYAFNATTGDEIWHVNYGASWDSSPIICDGMVIQVTIEIIEPGVYIWSTCVLNETTGELIRKFEGKGSPSTPLVHDDKIFIPSDDWRTWAFDLMTGKEVWHTVELHNGTFQDHSYCSPAAAGGAIYYQSLNGTFYVINETDGGILWSYALEGFGFGSPSIGDGCVFITNDFALYAFKIGPGSGDWPMFCQNNLHRSCSEQGVEYVRWPLTQPKDFGDISNTWVTAKFFWCNKTINSAAIAWRIYFFDNAGNVNATDTKIFYVNMPIHNIAITYVVPEETIIEQNQTKPINVTAVNNGNYAEKFNVTLCYDSSQIGFQNLTLNAGESRILTFEWNTTGVPCDDYILNAHASKVPVEADIEDNTYTLEYPVTVIPEFPSTTIILIGFVVFTLIVVVLIRKGKTRM